MLTFKNPVTNDYREKAMLEAVMSSYIQDNKGVLHYFYLTFLKNRSLQATIQQTNDIIDLLLERPDTLSLLLDKSVKFVNLIRYYRSISYSKVGFINNSLLCCLLILSNYSFFNISVSHIIPFDIKYISNNIKSEQERIFKCFDEAIILYGDIRKNPVEVACNKNVINFTPYYKQLVKRLGDKVEIQEDIFKSGAINFAVKNINIDADQISLEGLIGTYIKTFVMNVPSTYFSYRATILNGIQLDYKDPNAETVSDSLDYSYDISSLVSLLLEFDSGFILDKQQITSVLHCYARYKFGIEQSNGVSSEDSINRSIIIPLYCKLKPSLELKPFFYSSTPQISKSYNKIKMNIQLFGNLYKIYSSSQNTLNMIHKMTDEIYNCLKLRLSQVDSNTVKCKWWDIDMFDSVTSPSNNTTLQKTISVFINNGKRFSTKTVDKDGTLLTQPVRFVLNSLGYERLCRLIKLFVELDKLDSLLVSAGYRFLDILPLPTAYPAYKMQSVSCLQFKQDFCLYDCETLGQLINLNKSFSNDTLSYLLSPHISDIFRWSYNPDFYSVENVNIVKRLKDKFTDVKPKKQSLFNFSSFEEFEMSTTSLDFSSNVTMTLQDFVSLFKGLLICLADPKHFDIRYYTLSYQKNYATNETEFKDNYYLHSSSQSLKVIWGLAIVFLSEFITKYLIVFNTIKNSELGLYVTKIIKRIGKTLFPSLSNNDTIFKEYVKSNNIDNCKLWEISDTSSIVYDIVCLSSLIRYVFPSGLSLLSTIKLCHSDMISYLSSVSNKMFSFMSENFTLNCGDLKTSNDYKALFSGRFNSSNNNIYKYSDFSRLESAYNFISSLSSNKRSYLSLPEIITSQYEIFSPMYTGTFGSFNYILPYCPVTFLCGNEMENCYGRFTIKKNANTDCLIAERESENNFSSISYRDSAISVMPYTYKDSLSMSTVNTYISYISCNGNINKSTASVNLEYSRDSVTEKYLNSNSLTFTEASKTKERVTIEYNDELVLYLTIIDDLKTSLPLLIKQCETGNFSSINKYLYPMIFYLSRNLGLVSLIILNLHSIEEAYTCPDIFKRIFRSNKPESLIVGELSFLPSDDPSNNELYYLLLLLFQKEIPFPRQRSSIQNWSLITPDTTWDLIQTVIDASEEVMSMEALLSNEIENIYNSISIASLHTLANNCNLVNSYVDKLSSFPSTDLGSAVYLFSITGLADLSQDIQACISRREQGVPSFCTLNVLPSFSFVQSSEAANNDIDFSVDTTSEFSDRFEFDDIFSQPFEDIDINNIDAFTPQIPDVRVKPVLANTVIDMSISTPTSYTIIKANGNDILRDYNLLYARFQDFLNRSFTSTFYTRAVDFDNYINYAYHQIYNIEKLIENSTCDAIKQHSSSVATEHSSIDFVTANFNIITQQISNYSNNCRTFSDEEISENMQRFFSTYNLIVGSNGFICYKNGKTYIHKESSTKQFAIHSNGFGFIYDTSLLVPTITLVDRYNIDLESLNITY